MRVRYRAITAREYLFESITVSKRSCLSPCLGVIKRVRHRCKVLRSEGVFEPVLRTQPVKGWADPL
jgi:hypothetical protein